MDSTLPGITYVPNLLQVDEQTTLFERLKELDFRHRAYGPKAREQQFQGPQKELLRGYYQFGHAYSFTGKKFETAEPIPDYLVEVRERGLPYCPAGLDFNMCVIMHYPAGTRLGWHVDGARFGECVMGMSLGSETKMQFRKEGSEDVCHEQALEVGSMYALSGTVRWEYEHQLPQHDAERISITFRCLDV